MALDLELDIKSTVDVVCSKDNALDMEDEEFREYLPHPNEPQRLKYKDGLGWEDTTRFVLRKVLPYEAAQKVMKEQISADIKGNIELNLSFILEEARSALVDIRNPKDCPRPLEYKRDSDGKCSKDLIAGLYTGGVLTELQAARAAAIKQPNVEVVKKSVRRSSS